MANDATLTYLLWLAAVTGVVHTILGPDHYIPFIAMARARDWSPIRMLVTTALCGVGHVLGSIALGSIGIALGWAAGSIEGIESIRAELAGWLFLGFGLAYTAWGIRRAVLDRPHGHLHLHPDGTVHRHKNGQRSDHVHEDGVNKDRSSLTGWTLFTIFIFGPCEPLIPQLMYPAALRSVGGLVLVTCVFAVATISTMMLAVTVGWLGVKRFPLAPLQRYMHALSGLALTACGLAIKMGL